MANRKISQLTALTTPAAGDYLPIVDISEAADADKNKRITIEELLRGAPDGTAAAPSIAFESDPDSGLYRTGANGLALATGGTGRLFVDSAGAVDVSSANARLYISTTGTNTATATLRNASYFYNINLVGSSGDLQLFNGTERLRITSDGKLGLGTSSPDALLTVNGVGAHGLGSAAAPSFAFTGDLNTGIYSPGADQVAISTGGTGRLFIDSSGKVGIGANPLVALYVQSSTAPGIQFGYGAGYALHGLEWDSAGASLRVDRSNTTANSKFTIDVDGSERLRITSDGKLGLGTSSPDALLTVNGVGAHGLGSAAAPSFAFTGDLDTGIYSPGANQVAISTAGSGRLFVDGSGNVGINVAAGGATGFGSGFIKSKAVIGAPGLFLENSNGTSWSGVYGGTSLADSTAIVYPNGGYLRIATTTGPSVAGFSEKLRITSDGKLGLGTSSPTQVLTVADTTAAQIHLHSVAPAIRLSSDTGGNDIANRAFFGLSTSANGFINGSALNDLCISGTSGGKVLFGRGNTASMTLDSIGRLGLGTSSPGAGIHVKRASSGGQAILDNTGEEYTALDYYNNGSRKAAVQWRNSINTLRIDTFGAGSEIAFRTVDTERLRINAAGNVGIGTQTPGHALDATGNIRATGNIYGNTTVQTPWLLNETASDLAIWNSQAYSIKFITFGAERARIDSSGRLLVGTSSARTYAAYGSAGIQNEATTFSKASLGLTNNQNTPDGVALMLGKTRGTAVGDNTIVASNDVLGIILFQGADGTALRSAATIAGLVDGNPSAGDMPGRLVFSTSTDGSASPTERMRIRNDGSLWHGTTTGAIGTAAFGFVINDNVVEFAKNRGAGNTVMGVYGNAGHFRIRGDGDAENTNNSYTGISDIKLKENIIDANSQWDDLKALQVRNYNFKAETGYSTHTQIGLIAQEVELVSPGLVGESIDDETGESTKSVNYSVLYMKAVKALQEAMERIETLEQRLNDAGIA